MTNPTRIKTFHQLATLPQDTTLTYFFGRNEPQTLLLASRRPYKMKGARYVDLINIATDDLWVVSEEWFDTRASERAGTLREFYLTETS